MKRSSSFREKIYNYNIMLIMIVMFICMTYLIINDRTNRKFDQTYNCFNELNEFYSNSKRMNDGFQIYIYSPNDDMYKKFIDDYKNAVGNIERIMQNMRYESEIWRFQLLINMLDDYISETDHVIRSNMDQEIDSNDHYQQLLYKYELIVKTSSEYYDVLTEDLRIQKIDVNQNKQMMNIVSFIFIAFAVIWMIYFTITSIRSITNPIDKLINNMNRIKKGEYDLTQISNVNQEMSVLCLALEDLSQNIQKNIQYANDKAELEKRVLEQQNESLKKDELLAQSELRTLQNQINPHFLFNTLNMIYKKAFSEGALETSELMEKTSQLLRYGLDNINRVSSLKKEIEAIANFNYIQQKRHSDRIRFILDVEDNLEDIQMPGMILQPLVENAVSHGLKNTLADGEVIVEVFKQGKDVVISVSDNGIGMSPVELEKLIINDFRMSDDDRVHLGLYNVTRRLKTFYGKRVKILVNSQEDCGFDITIRIQDEMSLE